MNDEHITLTPAAEPEEAAAGVPEIQLKREIAGVAAFLSLFWVVCLWNFWSLGIHAMGANAALFFGGLLGLVARTYSSRGLELERSWIWAMPFGLLAASYALHDNTYIKTINLFLFPIGLGAICLLNLRRTRVTFGYLLSTIGLTLVGPFQYLDSAFATQPRPSLRPQRKLFERQSLESRILLGVLISGVVIFCFVVPMLSSADEVFSQRMDNAYDYTIGPLLDLFEMSLVWRVLTFLMLSVLLVSFAVRLTEAHRPDDPVSSAPRDSVIAGILLVSVSLIYLLFLWIQLERFWLTTLPLDFEATERLVKNGFWQMLILTAFNLVLQIVTYRRTVAPVQAILFGFCLASVLLLASAAHRMYLYVTIYGLSHEKFFASYAVIYCAFLFLLFFWLFIRRQDADLIRIAAYAGIWVFAITTILPVEQVMVRVNLALARRPNSRINVDQMELFGADAYPLIIGQARQISPEAYFKLDERTRRSQIWIVPGSNLATPWSQWCERIERRIASQKWYERNLSSLRAEWAIRP